VNQSLRANGDVRKLVPEPYIPLFQAVLGLESDARTLALRAENGVDSFEPEGADAYKFEMADDISDFEEKEFLLSDWLGVGEASTWIGDPGCGKSTIIASLAVHVAAGRDWFGNQVAQGPVIYFAAERLGLTRRRIKGLQRYHGMPEGQPLAVASGPLDIRDRASARGFIDAVNRFEDRIGEPPALVILDTFSKVFGAGSEKEDADMSAAYANIDRIKSETAAHVAIVHHTGVSIDAKRRGRGSSVQTGSVDTSVVVTKANGGGCAEIVKQNDGEEGLKIVWGIESFVVATNAETGKETTVPIPVAPKGNLVGKFELKPPVAKSLAPSQSAALDSLKGAIGVDGIPSDGTPGFPADAPTVSLDQWRDAFYRDDTARAPDATPDTRRNRFNRARADLEKLSRVAVLGDRVWPIT
jgi:hypothetical protein